MKHSINIILLILIGSSYSFSQDQALPSPSFSLSRSASLGGAFTAVEDGMESVLYNPAAIVSNELVDGRFVISINPVGAALSSAYYQGLSDRQTKNIDYWLAAGGLFFKHLSFASSAFQLSFLLSEDLRESALLADKNSNYNTRGLLDNIYHAAALRISLARPVAIGGAAFMFNHYENGRKQVPSFGSSYGIYMRPSEKLHAGISYFYFPSHVDSSMLNLYGVRKNTINAGICYSPNYWAKIAVDVRNVSSDEEGRLSEYRAGIELLPSFRFALRGGFIRDYKNSNHISIGFGIGDFRPFRAQTDFVFSNIILNYALRSELNESAVLTHSLTFFIHL